MLEAVVFYTLATFILGLGILVITARTPVHSVLFLVLNFLLVAVLYVTLGALLGGAVLAELIAIIFASRRNTNTVVNATSDMPARLSDPMLNTEQLGWLLYTEYLIPFELASMLLLVAMIGAIVLAKKNI